MTSFLAPTPRRRRSKGRKAGAGLISSLRKSAGMTLNAEHLETRVLLTSVTNYEVDYALSAITEIKIGGRAAGESEAGKDDGYDQINVLSGHKLTIADSLQIDFVNDFLPVVGDHFEILTYGTTVGQFTDATRLFGFGDGSMYFDLVHDMVPNALSLVVKAAPGNEQLRLVPTSNSESWAVGKVLSDYFSTSNTTTVTQGAAYLAKSELPFVGSFDIEKTGSGEIKILATATYLLGQGSGTTSEAGVKITAAGGGITANADGVAAHIKGTASLVGVDHVSLTGSLIQRVNTTNAPVDVIIKPDGSTATIPADINELSGAVTLQIDDFAYLSGNMTFSRSENTPVTLKGGDTDAASLLTIGADNVIGFAGTNGPYFTVDDDTNNNGRVDPGEQVNPAAVGVAMEGTRFGMALFNSTTANPTTGARDTWYALKSRTSTVKAVGLSNIDVSGAFDFQINRADASNIKEQVIDFQATFPDPVNDPDNTGGPKVPGLLVGIGGVPVLMDFQTKLLRAAWPALPSIKPLSIVIDHFFYISGAFAFELGRSGDVVLDGGAETTVQMLTLSGTGDVFSGSNGPEDDAFDPASPGDATGLMVQDTQFALAFLNSTPADFTARPVTPTAAAVTATLTISDNAGFVLPADQRVSGVILHQGSLSVRVPASNYMFTKATNTVTITNRNLVPGIFWDKIATNPVTATVERNSSTTFTAAAINSGLLSTVGLDGIAISGQAELLFNTTSVTNGPAVDFTKQAASNPLTVADTGDGDPGLRVSTGPDAAQFVDLGFTGEFLRVAGQLTVIVDSFIYATGNLAFEKGRTGNVMVKNGVGGNSIQNVELLTIGGTATVFAGINGPATNPTATGLKVEGTRFALALMNTAPLDITARPVTPTAAAVTATLTLSDDAGFVLAADQQVSGVILHQGSLSVRVPASNYTFNKANNTVTITNRNLVSGILWDKVATNPVTATVERSSSISYYATSVSTGVVSALGISGVTVSGAVQVEVNDSDAAGDSYVDFSAVPAINPLDDDPANDGLRISTGVATTEFMDFNYQSKFLRVGLAGLLKFGGTTSAPLVTIDASFDRNNLPVNTATPAAPTISVVALPAKQGIRGIVLKQGATLGLQLPGNSYTLNAGRDTITIDPSKLPTGHGFDFTASNITADVGVTGTTINFTKSVTALGTEIEIQAGTIDDELAVIVDMNGDPLGVSGSLHMKFNDLQTTLISSSLTARSGFSVKDSSGKAYLALTNPGVTLENITISGGTDILGITEVFPNAGAPAAITLTSTIDVGRDIERGDVVKVVLRDRAGYRLTLNPDAVPPQYTVNADTDTVTLSVSQSAATGFDLNALLVDITFAPKIGIRASEVKLFEGNTTFSITIEDSKGPEGDADIWAIEGKLNLTTKDFRLVLDTFQLTLGSYLTFNSTQVVIDTTAPNDIIAEFGSLGARIKAGTLDVKGTAYNFGIKEDGSLTTLEGKAF